MDRFVKEFIVSSMHGPLSFCDEAGVAYQTDMSTPMTYDDSYMEKFEAYDDDIASAVNFARIVFVLKIMMAHSGAVSHKVLDIGAGNGMFIEQARNAGVKAFGFDLIPAANAALKSAGLYRDDIGAFLCVTMWDVIEHLPDPEQYLNRMPHGSLLFVSLPLFSDLNDVFESKHYRPGEHLYYWTLFGFVQWMALHGFRGLWCSGHEMEAGRESIWAFAFQKDVQ